MKSFLGKRFFIALLLFSFFFSFANRIEAQENSTDGTKAVVIRINGFTNPPAMTVCPGDFGPLFGQISGCSGSVTYPSPRWTYTGTGSLNILDPNASITQIDHNGSDEGTYTVTFTANCNSVAYTNSIQVTVSSSDTLYITAPVTETYTICESTPITFTATGTDDYSWFRDGVAIGTGSSVSDTPPGPGTYIYDVEGTNSYGCFSDPARDTVTVTVNTAPTADANAGAAYEICADSYVLLNGNVGGAAIANQCNWSTNGDGQFTDNGGTPTTNFNSATRYYPGATDISNGTVTLTLTTNDPAGPCTAASDNAAVTVYALPLITNVASTDISCNGANDGTITITATDALAIEYSIDGGGSFQAGNSFTGLGPGNYNIVVRNAQNCETTYAANPVTIVEPSAISITNVAVTDVLCNGGSSGEITITANGGTAPLTYSINGGTSFQANPTFSGLTAGNYNIQVRDANGCVQVYGSNPVAVGEPSAINITNIAATDVLCNGGASGQIVITANGGTAPLTYSINGGTTFQASNTFNGLTAGNYNVQVQDANGCTEIYGSNPVVINEPVGINITNIATTDVLCNGAATGEITITANGGTAPLTYSINGGGSYQASNTFIGLTAGNYNVQIRDANGCIQVYGSNPVVINEPPTGINITNVAVTDVLCNGASTGEITITANGGTAPLTYSIDGGGSYQASNTFTGLAAGNYNVQVQDANGCTEIYGANPVTVSEPSAINITNIATTDVLCNGGANGQIIITANGGTAPLTYSINGGATFQASNTFNGLTAGNYNVQIRDANGCTQVYGSNPVVINEPAGINITNIAVTDVLCNGGATGQIIITANGGTAPLTYSINGGATFQASNTFNGLTAGNYDVQIQDANGCIEIYGSNPVTVSEPAGINITNVAVTDVFCNGGADGQIVVTANGGTAPLTYSIDGGATFQASNTFSGLTAGNYNVQVQDANGCTEIYGANPVTVSEPAGINITNVATTDVLCNGAATGQIVITANGGSAPLTYSIDGGATFQASNTFNSLTAGNYNVQVQDANGCTEIYGANPVVISEPSGINITNIATTDVLCNGGATGQIIITANGGTAPLTYSIDGGATFQASNTFNGLTAGNYNVQVQDANGCTEIHGSNPVVINEPASAISITNIATTDVLCNGAATGQIIITANGGTAPLTYSINGGATFQASNTFNSLTAGNYNVQVQDANGCTEIYGSNPVVINEPANGIAITNVATTNVLCNGAATGQIIITANGGTAPLTYSIDGGATFQASNTFNSLTAGNYNVQVQDANGCTEIYGANPVVITEPANGIAITNVATTDVLCNGAATGQIIITANGGTAPLTYSIDGGATFQASNTFNGLTAGNYNVQVQDANGCIEIYGANPVVINEPANAISITNVATTDVLCNGAATGQIIITANGGTAPLTYSINGGATFQASNTFSGLTAGNYNVQVQDANGCIEIYGANPVVINEPANGIAITNVATTNVLCNGAATGQIIVTANGGTAPLTYSIDGGATFQASNTFNSLTAGNYNVQVQDANGCTEIYGANPVVITEPANGIAITNVATTDVLCNGAATGQIIITANGGTAPLTYSIDGGATFQASNTFNGLTAGNYNVQVQDANGCIEIYGSNPVVINEPAGITIQNVSSTDVLCNGGASGQISITAAGGVAPLTYSIDGGTSYQASNTFNGLTAGNYNVQVQDANGCIEIYGSNPVIINEPTAINITNVAVTNVTCNGGNDGQLVITANGGTAPLTYSIDGGATFQASNTFSGLTAGSYNIQVQDANGCIAIYTLNPVAINEPAPITINITPPDPAQMCNNDTINLNGNPAGGATGNFVTHLWAGNGPGPLVYSDPNIVNPTFTTNVAGIYQLTYTVTDIDGCQASETLNLTVNGLPKITATVNANPLCEEQDLILTADPPSTYSNYNWTGPAGFTSNQAIDTILNVTVANAGDYTVTVQDINGCENSSTVNVIINPKPIADAGNDTTICFPINGGSVDLGGNPSASNGSGDYTYQWTEAPDWNTLSGQENIANPLNIQPQAFPTTYTLIVIDNITGCSDTATKVVDAFSASILEANAGNSGIVCHGNNSGTMLGGNAFDPTAEGGTAPYSYQWSSSPLDPTLALNGNDTIANPIVYVTVTTTYTVDVTDANGCIASSSVIFEPKIEVIANAGPRRDTMCYGEDYTLGGNPTAVQGTPGYTYQWNTIPPPFVVLPGANDANPVLPWSLIPPGTDSIVFTVEVKDEDGFGCVDEDTITLYINNELFLDLGITDTTMCNGLNGGLITIGDTATGGTPGYTYHWTANPAYPWVGGQENDSVITVSPSVTTVFTLTVTDAAGCDQISSVNVIVNDAVIAEAGADIAICHPTNGGSATLGGIPTGSGGSGGFTYIWAEAPNNGTLAGQEIDPNPLVTPNVITTYTVTVTDAVGCSDVDSIIVDVHDLFEIDVNQTSGGTICTGVNGGVDTISFEVTNNGNYPIDIYEWTSNPAGLISTDSAIYVSPNEPTWYIARITDNLGCYALDSIMVDTFPQLTVLIDPDLTDSTICAGFNGGSIQLDATHNSTQPIYTYDWSSLPLDVNFEDTTINNPIVSPNQSTAYTVVVTDGNGCYHSDMINVDIHDPIVAVPSPTGLDTVGLCQVPVNGDSLTLGGTPPYLPYSNPNQLIFNWDAIPPYAWTGSNQTLPNPNVAPVEDTWFFLTVTDSVTGCLHQDSVFVDAYDTLFADAYDKADVQFCFGDPLTLGGSPTASGGSSANYSYEWYEVGQAAILFTNANPFIPNVTNTTTYAVVVTDIDGGCTASDTVTIYVAPQIFADAGNDTTLCDGGCVTLGGDPSAWGGVPYQDIVAYPNGYEFIWGTTHPFAPEVPDSVTANPVVCLDIATLGSNSVEYTLNVIDSFGCAISGGSIIIDLEESPVVDIPDDLSDTVCVNQFEAIWNANDFIVSGTPPYTYEWRANGQLFSTDFEIFVAPDTTTVYHLTVFNNNTGNGEACHDSDSITITVNPELIAIVDSIVQPANCGEASGIIYASSSGGGDISLHTYTWYEWDGASYQLLADTDPTLENITRGLYMLVVEDGACVDTIYQGLSDLHAPIIAIDGDTMLCAGEPYEVFIEDNDDTDQIEHTFTWAFDGSVLQTGFADTLIGSTNDLNLGSNIIQISSDSADCIANNVWELEVIEVPNAEITADTTKVCQGDPVQLEVPFSVLHSYTWGPGTHADTNSITVYPTDTLGEQYWVEILNINDPIACPGYDTITIDVLPRPIVTMDYSQSLACGPDSAFIGDTVPDAQYTYTWTAVPPYPGLLVNAPNQMVKPSVTTWFYLTVEHPNNECDYYDSIMVAVGTPPPADAGIDQFLCIGDSAYIGDSLANTTDLRFTWTSSPIIPLPYEYPEVPGFEYVPNDDITFFLEVTDTITGCRNLDTVFIEVFNETAQITPGFADACFGDTVTFTAVDTINGVDYEWTIVGGGQSFSRNGFSIPVEAISDWNVYLDYTDIATGCPMSTGSADLDLFNTRAYALGGDTICFGDTLFLQASLQTVTTNPDFYWIASDAPGDTVWNQAILPVSPTDIITNYTVYVNDSVCNNYSSGGTHVMLDIPSIVQGIDTTVCKYSNPIIGSHQSDRDSYFTWYKDTVAGDHIVHGPTWHYYDTLVPAYFDTVPFEIYALDTTTYILEATTWLRGCKTYDTLQVNVPPLQDVELTLNTTLLNVDTLAYDSVEGEYSILKYYTAVEGQRLTLTAEPNDFERYIFHYWHTDSTLLYDGVSNKYTNSISFEEGYTLLLAAYDTLGCISNDRIIVISELEIPNAFTPFTVDGKNDIFMEGLPLTILNRWGQKIFEGEEGWDGTVNGKQVSPGTYFYIIEIKVDNKKRTYKGTVLVVDGQ